MKMRFTFDGIMHCRRTKNNIDKANFIESLQKQANEEFSKNITEGLFNYYGFIQKREKKIKKIYFEVIFNT